MVVTPNSSSDSSQIGELLRCFPLLADLSPSQLDELAAQGQLWRYSLGQPICRLDQGLQHLLFLLQGQARSVVMSPRLPRGVSTLERLDSGALLGWTSLSCGRNWETLIASTELVVIAIPYGAMGAAMDACPALAGRLQAPIHPAELFAVLDAHLADYPRARPRELLEAALTLSPHAKARWIQGPDLLTAGWDPSDLNLVAAGPLPLGSPLPTNLATAPKQPLRVLSLDQQALASLLEPGQLESASEPSPNGHLWQQHLLTRWQQQQVDSDGIEIHGAEPLRMTTSNNGYRRISPGIAAWVLWNPRSLPSACSAITLIFPFGASCCGGSLVIRWLATEKPPWLWRGPWPNRLVSRPNCWRSKPMPWCACPVR